MGLVDELAYEDELDDLGDGDLARRRRSKPIDYAAVSWESARCRAALDDRRDQRRRRHHSGRSGFDPVNGRWSARTRIVEYIREARADRVDQGHRPARRQPRRIVDGLGRDLARADDLEARGAAADRVDVRPGGVRRLLHRRGRRRDRRAARHADRVDRRLHRQVRDRRHPRRSSAPTSRRVSQRQARRDLLARSAVHARGARQGPGVDAGRLRPVRRAGRRVARTRRRRRSTRSRRGACGPAQQAQADWAGRRTRRALRRHRRWPSSARAFPRTRKWSWSCIPPRAASTKCSSEELQSPVGRNAGAHDGRRADVAARPARAPGCSPHCSRPSRLFRSGEILAHMPYVFVR